MLFELTSGRLIERSVSCAARIEIAHGAVWDDAAQITESGVPMDLTSAILEVVIRPTYDDTILLAFLTSGAGDILIDDATHGKFSFAVSEGQVEAIPAGAWVFVFRARLPGGPREIARGPILVHPAEYPA